MTLQVKDANASVMHLKGSGAGTSGDAFIPEHLETNSAAIAGELATLLSEADFDAKLTSLIALLPSALTTAGNLKVAIQEPIVRTWTSITPAVLASGDNTIAAAPGGGTLNIVKNIGFQNVGTTNRTISLKDGSTIFRTWILPAGASIEVNWGEGEEWRLTGAFVVNASAATDIQMTGGRYRVGLT